MLIRKVVVMFISMGASFAVWADVPRIPVPPDVAAAIHERGCESCHAWTTRKFGPAWDDVADHYRGKKKYDYKATGGKTVETLPLEEGLIKKVSNGGEGVWSKYMPMLANDPTGVHKDEITAIVKFILSIPPK